jgi:hypothetical protein
VGVFICVHGGTYPLVLESLTVAFLLSPFIRQTGTALLITLPLGAVLCFFDLLGARALAKGEVQ